jgi:hypothetical protein
VFRAEDRSTSLIRGGLASATRGSQSETAAWTMGTAPSFIEFEARRNAVWRFGRVFLRCPKCGHRATTILHAAARHRDINHFLAGRSSGGGGTSFASGIDGRIFSSERQLGELSSAHFDLCSSDTRDLPRGTQGTRVGRAVAEMSLASARSNRAWDADGGRAANDRRRMIADTPNERDRYAMDRASVAVAELLRD